MTLAEILAALAAHKPAEIVAALPRGDGTLFQSIFQQGYDSRHAKAETDEAALNQKLKDAEKAKTTVERELADLKANPSKAPEVAAIVERHNAEKAELVAAHNAELEKRDQAVEQERRNTQLSQLQTLLTNPPEALKETLGGKALVPQYARILTQDQELAGRIRFNRDGSLLLVGKDGKTPLVGKDGKADISLLASELVGAADPTFVLVNGQRGSGVENGGGAGGAGAFYDQIRQQEAPPKPAPVDNGRPVPKTAAERLGVVEV